MSLGIPGDAVMALLLGALMIQGIVPGPQLISQHPDIFWGLVATARPDRNESGFPRHAGGASLTH